MEMHTYWLAYTVHFHISVKQLPVIIKSLEQNKYSYFTTMMCMPLLHRLLFILNFLHLNQAMFEWSQAKNQTYLKWYLKYHREYSQRMQTDSFPDIVNKLRQLVKEYENQSKTVPVEMNYIQYYPGESDVIIAVTKGGKLKPKSLPTRYRNYCKIDGHRYRFTKNVCKLYRTGAMFR